MPSLLEAIRSLSAASPPHAGSDRQPFVELRAQVPLLHETAAIRLRKTPGTWL
ncbi:MAG TPA: hypothetical protein QGI30_05000 [Anaerolineales bacterium]|nr:hypothetical protein [Anaerolineales bacterium]